MTTLIFDFDGTIVDSSEDVLASLNFALRSTGLAAVHPLDSSIIGPPLASIIRSAVKSISAQELEHAIAAFRSHYDGSAYSCTVLYPGVMDVLQAARGIGAKSFIATNKPKHATVAILERLGVAKSFADVLCIEECPAADKSGLVGELLRRHAVPSGTGWMIGDAPGDMRAGKTHRLRTVAHLGGYSAPELLLAEQPDFAIERMNQLLGLLRVARGRHEQ